MTMAASSFGTPPGLSQPPSAKIPAPSSPKAKSMVSEQLQMTPKKETKRRRERLIKLAAFRAQSHEEHARGQCDIEEELNSLAERVHAQGAEFRETVGKIEAGQQSLAAKVDEGTQAVDKKMEALGRKMDSVMDALQTLVQVRTATSNVQPDAKACDEEDEDALDKIYCSTCMKVTYACSCKSPAYETMRCTNDECEYSVPHSRLSLQELEKLMTCANFLDSVEMNGICPSCEAPTLERQINCITCGDSICEQCCGVEASYLMFPCSASGCASEGCRFHRECLIEYESASEEYICKQCHAEGKTVLVDSAHASDEEEDDEDDDDDVEEETL